MALAPIPSIASGTAAVGVGPAASAPRVASGAAAEASGAAGPSGFADAISDALDTVSDSHAEADRLALQAATGDLASVHDYTVAVTEAQLLTQLTVEVRNRAIEAFNDIMRMQV